MDSFAVDNSTENYMDNSTFCSAENSKTWSEENLSINSGNKLEVILTEDSISNIPSGINSSIRLEENYNSEITYGINLPTPSGTN